MSKRDDSLFVKDMLERIHLVETFTTNGQDAFFHSRITQEAVIRSLEVIGEASRNVSEQLRQTYPDVPWRQITAFRNFVVHAYWDIKLERVWSIVTDELPSLKEQLQTILGELPDED